MKLIQVKDKDEMSRLGAKHIIHRVNNQPKLVLGLATGGTPLGTYHYLVDEYNKKRISYQDVTTVNLDEYVGLTQKHPNSYHTYMEENLFKFIDIPLNKTHIPDGSADNLDKECQEYDTLIESLGGIDLQLLGIGENGHIGFNEPGTSFDQRTHVIELTESTRVANARYFSKIEDVPKFAITMGILTICESKEIVLLVSGENKAEALDQLLRQKKEDEAFPASALIHHPNLTIYADESALSLYKSKR
ncbi:glucosamine-6-phosphate deaminase [Terrilactibacillus sp. BCM23-1]|uniref:Glucosamine-6-phosphate deaminase n=1 Tax=Terrilactibacillus tamarindi TaxID=2599694 RepID=A0A6N8CSY6_9BACI|nr:glucosamine-6-phosphate deaminase [Terrilactibacillus tamarindi]MTT33289.1 glucosamine-6-phosphate deaminase [Terrilactibacillus tamarindi]